MSLDVRQKGATLLELIIAMALVILTVVITSLTFPKAARSITTSRQRWFANNFASSRMQELKSHPYALIDVTPATSGNFPNSGTGEPGGCDCNQEDFSGITEDARYTEESVDYVRRVCINFVERTGLTWTSHCPPIPPLPLTDARDKGLKNVRIQVSWTSGAHTNTTEMEGVVAR